MDNKNNIDLNLLKNIKIDYDFYITDKSISLEDAIIPSKDVRNYHKKIGFKLSDFEKAGLIVLSRKLSYFRKLKELKNISDNTNDDKLKEDIEYYINCMENIYKSFVYNDDKKAIYYIEALYEGDKEYIDNGFFFEFKDALNACKNIKGEYRIQKNILIYPEDDYEQDEDGLIDSEIGYMGFSENGTISYIYSYIVESEPFDSDKFYGKYLSIPDPFKSGDIVYDYEHSEIGVVCSKSWKNRSDFMKKIGGDNSDMICNIDVIWNESELLEGTGSFGYIHGNPLYYEYYKLKDDGNYVDSYYYNDDLDLDERIERARDAVYKMMSLPYIKDSNLSFSFNLNDALNSYIELLKVRNNLKDYKKRGIINE